MFPFLLAGALCIGPPSPDPIKNLGHSDYRERERAQSRLSATMDFAVYVRLRDFQCNDAETAKRKKDILEVLEGKFCAKMRGTYKVDCATYPWIDMGLGEQYRWNGMCWGQIKEKYFHSLPDRKVAAYYPPDYQKYRAATQLWVQDRVELALMEALRSAATEAQIDENMKVSLQGIQKDLAAMAEAEENYRKRPPHIFGAWGFGGRPR